MTKRISSNARVKAPLTDLENEVMRVVWDTGPCSVELRANVQAPVFLLPIEELGPGYFWRASFTLVPGETVHDYLRP